MMRYHSTQVIVKNISPSVGGAKAKKGLKKKERTIEIEISNAENENNDEVKVELFSPSSMSSFTFKPKFYKPSQIVAANQSSMVTMRNQSNSTPDLLVH